MKSRRIFDKILLLMQIMVKIVSLGLIYNFIKLYKIKTCIINIFVLSLLFFSLNFNNDITFNSFSQEVNTSLYIKDIRFASNTDRDLNLLIIKKMSEMHINKGPCLITTTFRNNLYLNLDLIKDIVHRTALEKK